MPFANMFGSLATAPLLRRFGRGAISFGALFCGLSAVAILIAVRGATDSIDPIVLLPGVVLLGFGLGISIASGIAIVLGDVPHANAGSAAGVQATGLQLAGAVGIALYGIAFYGAIGVTENLSGYLAGMRWVMWISIALAAVQVALMYRLPKHRLGAEEDIPLGDPELLVFPDLHGD
jgi:MFS family permease